MKDSATRRGYVNEVQKWELFEKYAGFRKDTFKANISFDDLKNIDSKSGKMASYRKDLMESFLKTHDKMPGINFRSSLRGDVLCENLKLIVDLKNYASVQETMKLPEFLLEDYIKGIDSNIKYPS